MNKSTLSDLEFIQITCSSRGREKSLRPRRQVKKARRRSYRYVENVFDRQRRHGALQPEFTLDFRPLAFLSRAIERGIWIHSKITNKPNSPIVQLSASLFTATIYTISISLTKVKNKPNTNPIKLVLECLSRGADKIALKIYPFGIDYLIVYIIFEVRLWQKSWLE
jgi:hypothetical protein